MCHHSLLTQDARQIDEDYGNVVSLGTSACPPFLHRHRWELKCGFDLMGNRSNCKKKACLKNHEAARESREQDVEMDANEAIWPFASTMSRRMPNSKSHGVQTHTATAYVSIDRRTQDTHSVRHARWERQHSSPSSTDTERRVLLTHSPSRRQQIKCCWRDTDKSQEYTRCCCKRTAFEICPITTTRRRALATRWRRASAVHASNFHSVHNARISPDTLCCAPNLKASCAQTTKSVSSENVCTNTTSGALSASANAQAPLTPILFSYSFSEESVLLAW